MIDKVDVVLLAERPTERYRKAYDRWLDESSLPEYRQLYDKVFQAVPVAVK